MAYAVVKTGGKQYTVKEGDVLQVELISEKQQGDQIELDTLAYSNGSDLQVGTPELETKVTATILDTGRKDKVTVLHKRRRSTYRKKNGHRQSFHQIRIESIPS